MSNQSQFSKLFYKQYAALEILIEDNPTRAAIASAVIGFVLGAITL